MARAFFFIIVIAIAILSVHSYVLDEKANCKGPNRKWNECASSRDSKCGDNDYLLDIKVCFDRCACLPGYVEAKDGKCVLPENCY